MKKKVKKTKSNKKIELDLKKNIPKIYNIIAIVLGGISIILSFFIPFLVGITGILGLIFAYVQKEKGSRKLNLWAFIINLIGVFLAIIILMISLIVILLGLNPQPSLVGAL